VNDRLNRLGSDYSYIFIIFNMLVMVFVGLMKNKMFALDLAELTRIVSGWFRNDPSRFSSCRFHLFFIFFICDSSNVVIFNTIIVIRVGYFDMLQFCGWIGLVLVIIDLLFSNFDFFFFNINLFFFDFFFVVANRFFFMISYDILQLGSINSFIYIFIKVVINIRDLFNLGCNGNEHTSRY
jgi:hypothetical protein